MDRSRCQPPSCSLKMLSELLTQLLFFYLINDADHWMGQNIFTSTRALAMEQLVYVDHNRAFDGSKGLEALPGYSILHSVTKKICLFPTVFIARLRSIMQESQTFSPHLRALAEQERKRGLIRVIVRAWREVADGRRAHSLRSATDNHIETHASSRMPNNVLSGAHTSFRPRIPMDASANVVAARWNDLQDEEMRCEGGSRRLPSARSALPSWSCARLFLTHIRLVEGGRLDARRKSSAQGTRKRQLTRKWRAERRRGQQRRLVALRGATDITG